MLFVVFKISAQADSVGYWIKAYETVANDKTKLELLENITSELCQSDPKKSLGYSELEIALASKLKNNKRLSDAYVNKASAMLELGKYKESLNCNLKGLKIAEQLNDSFRIAICNNRTGIFYHVTNSFQQAEKYYLKSLELFTTLKDVKSMYILYNNLSDIYSKTGRQELAEQCLEKSITARKKSKNTSSIGIGYYTMAYYLAENKKQQQALTTLDSALFYINKAGNRYYYSQAMVLKGECLTAVKKYKESKDMLEHFIAVDTIAQGSMDLLDAVYMSLSKNYEGLNMPEEALKYARIEKKVSDSLYKAENLKSLSEAQAKFDTEKQEQQIGRLNDEKKISESELKRQKIIRNTFLFGSIIFLIFSVVIFRSLQLNRKSKKVIEVQKEELETKNKEVLDSIHYAKRIQTTLMAHSDFLATNLNEHFVLFKPKDIVSGDFYWATKKNNRIYVAVCDSTGHGVPGAFMSLLNINFLNEAVNEKNIARPNEIFNHVRKRLIENISQDGAQDGMDGILICLDKDHQTITYAAANNYLLIYKDGQLKDLPADKMPVGKGQKEEEFNLYTIENYTGATLYLYTDGYADQFGGPKGKKFKDKNLNILINSIATLSMADQKQKLDTEFESWKASLEQVDDVCVIGIKV